MPKIVHKDLEVISFRSRDLFYKWLGKRFDRDDGFWLRYFKKGSGKPSIQHSDAVDVALCWGWIDGLINKYDEESYLVRYTPRRPKSVWSKVNVAKVERLLEEGLMQPSGLAHVETAKADGRWDAAYAGQATMELPNEFLRLLKNTPTANSFYKSLTKANKYAIAFRIATCVGDEKRLKMMNKMIEMLADQKSFHPNQ